LPHTRQHGCIDILQCCNDRRRHQFHSNPGRSQLTYHTLNILCAVCTMAPEDEKVILGTCRGP
jgi:hypothetical protein